MTDITDFGMLKYSYGKKGEQIVAELFRKMGFSVWHNGVEYQNPKNVTETEIYAPDLRLYDEFHDCYFYIEVKTPLYYKPTALYISEKNLDKYYEHFPKNSFVAIYYARKGRIGMRLIQDLANLSRKKLRFEKPVMSLSRKNKQEILLKFPFNLFHPISYYGTKHFFSDKFNWKMEKVKEFLEHYNKPMALLQNEFQREKRKNKT